MRAVEPNVEQHNHWPTDGTLRSTFAQSTISSREKGQSYVLTDAKKRAQARGLQGIARGASRYTASHAPVNAIASGITTIIAIVVKSSVEAASASYTL